VIWQNSDDDVSIVNVEAPVFAGSVLALFVTSVLAMLGVVAYKYLHDKDERGERITDEHTYIFCPN